VPAGTTDVQNAWGLIVRGPLLRILLPFKGCTPATILAGPTGRHIATQQQLASRPTHAHRCAHKETAAASPRLCLCKHRAPTSCAASREPSASATVRLTDVQHPPCWDGFAWPTCPAWSISYLAAEVVFSSGNVTSWRVSASSVIAPRLKYCARHTGFCISIACAHLDTYQVEGLVRLCRLLLSCPCIATVHDAQWSHCPYH
jgi:hypothetical protein